MNQTDKPKTMREWLHTNLLLLIGDVQNEELMGRNGMDKVEEKTDFIINEIFRDQLNQIFEEIEKEIPWKFTPVEMTEKKEGWNEAIDIMRLRIARIRQKYLGSNEEI